MKIPAGLAATLAGAVAAGPALAAPETISSRYLCERGVEVPVVYVNGAEGSVAVIHVEGRMIVLHQGMSGSGARYEWPSGGSGYVWWSKGDEATLLWKDGASGEEAPVLSACKALS